MGNCLSTKSNSINNIILLVVIAELFLMGGGRFVEIGSFTLRMVLFVIAQFYTIIMMFKFKVRVDALNLCIYFFASLLLSAFIGLLNGAELALVLNDIKPLSYFMMILFFSVTITDRQSIMLIAKSVKVCSVIIMVVYFVILIGLYFKLIDYNIFYDRMIVPGEVVFRSGIDIGFFYKGFLYLCVGFLFYLFSNKKADKLISSFLLLSIVLTFTRGLLISLAATIIVFIVFYTDRNKRLKYLALLVAIVALISPWFVAQLGDKTDSNMIRIVAYERIKEALTPVSFFLGHGLGIGVEEQLEHMEISYLEIFHKQGVVGLSLWLIIFVMIIVYYSKISVSESKKIALPFVLSTVLIYIQTATNPYLNNPIGMSMVLISLSVVKVLRDETNV